MKIFFEMEKLAFGEIATNRKAFNEPAISRREHVAPGVSPGSAVSSHILAPQGATDFDVLRIISAALFEGLCLFSM